MRLFFFLLFLSVFSLKNGAQDTTRILFIGNSFTFFHNMPGMVKSLADSSAIPVITGMHAPGGVSVGDTAQGNFAHMNNPALFTLIRSQKWDFAVIQDNQGRFVRDSAVFPGASKVVQGHLSIMDSVKANNSCAKIILFAGWAWKYGNPPFGNTGEETMRRILVNYKVLNDTMKEVIAPIAEAWIKASAQLPAVNLWDADDAHSSYAGSYLTASVIFSSIFDLPAQPIPFYGSLSPTTAAVLRSYGDSAVFAATSHTAYNLGGVQPLSISLGGSDLNVAGSFVAYRWYKNDVFVGSAPVLPLSGNGLYRLEAEEADGCVRKSCDYAFTNTGISLKKRDEDLLVFPSPVRQGALLQIRCGGEIEKAELYSLAGTSRKAELEGSGGNYWLSTVDLEPGWYVLKILAGKKWYSQRILVLN